MVKIYIMATDRILFKPSLALNLSAEVRMKDARTIEVKTTKTTFFILKSAKITKIRKMKLKRVF